MQPNNSTGKDKEDRPKLKSGFRPFPRNQPLKPSEDSIPKPRRTSKGKLKQRDTDQQGCNCRKSNCLKLYCRCFALGGLCGKGCFCVECKNMRDNMERSEAINAILEKDPLGFNIKQQAKGCNCRRSNCQKKYCDCFSEGKLCGPQCYCLDCHNLNIKTSPKKISN